MVRIVQTVLGVAALAGTLVLGTPALATLVLSTGNSGGGTDNVVFNPCGTSTGPALNVQGCLNTSNSTLVNFRGTENLVIDEGGGQARIDSEDDVFDFFEITLVDPDLGFTKLVFNLDATADGTAHFEAEDSDGNVFDFPDFPLGDTGQNFFNLIASNSEIAVRFTLLSTDDPQIITKLEQVRLGVVDTTQAAPEPSTLVLFGVGLLGLGVTIRRRMRSLTADLPVACS